MRNGQGKATIVPGIESGPEAGTSLSVEDLFGIIGRKQVLLEVLQVRIEQLGEMNLTLQREIATLRGNSSIPNSGIDEPTEGR